jgi:oligoribonuclease
MIDVSSIKELTRRWYPRVYFASPGKHGGHRALADIKESVQELRYYRETVFVPQPGPDSASAREIAARYTAPGPAAPGPAAPGPAALGPAALGPAGPGSAGPGPASTAGT